MIYELNIKILPRDVDFTKRLSAQTLGAIFLDAAGIAANASGFGMSYMNSKGAAWVMSRFSVHVYSLPVEYDTICVRTWVKSVNSIFSKRFFSAIDSDGNVLAEGDSLWSVININTRKMEYITSLADLTPFIMEEDIEMTSTVKVPKENAESCSLFNRVVCCSDIDMNMHVNTMKYFQWAFDTFTLDYQKENWVKRIDLNFVKEMRYADEVKIRRTDKDNVSVFCVSNAENDVCCRLKFTF